MNSYRITIMIFFFFIVPLDHASVTCNILVILMDLDVCIADGRLEKMDAETEQVEEQTDIPAAPAEETPPETKNRPGKHLDRGVKGRGRGCRMGRGWRGGRGMMKAFGPPGRGRGRGHDGLMNGFGPMRYTTEHFLLFLLYVVFLLSCFVQHSDNHSFSLLSLFSHAFVCPKKGHGRDAAVPRPPRQRRCEGRPKRHGSPTSSSPTPAPETLPSYAQAWPPSTPAWTPWFPWLPASSSRPQQSPRPPSSLSPQRLPQRTRPSSTFPPAWQGSAVARPPQGATLLNVATD
ncbi:uncharacterized protein si:ch211-51e12.7 isoform X2 [Clupea harengus]|uniref:Uncharacterized protein si:ch211-51e12.7 isoform X2 n=1 Tax=Clupea harengus TaxID=7950 RepID=A0A6P8GS91_CLUHA|nr:uncharacterized protein si:ch211-51e12.7 isoform X2 [Clupea harengus]